MWRIWAAALVWGLNWPAVRIILDSAGPWTLRAAGLAGGAALLLIGAVVSGHSLKVVGRDRVTIVLGGVIGVAAFNVFAAFAQLSMPTSRAAILTFTMPMWVALLSWLVLGEKIDARRVGALLLAAVGIGVLSIPFLDVVAAGGLPFGLVYVLGAAIAWAIGTVIVKARPLAIDPLVSTAWQITVAAIVCTLGLALFETPRLDLSDPRAAVAFAYHVALPQAVAYALWFALIKRVPASTAALGTLLIPIFGVAGAAVVLAERPTATDLAGLVLILSAVIVDQVGRSKP